MVPRIDPALEVRHVAALPVEGVHDGELGDAELAVVEVRHELEGTRARVPDELEELVDQEGDDEDVHEIEPARLHGGEPGGQARDHAFSAAERLRCRRRRGSPATAALEEDERGARTPSRSGCAPTRPGRGWGGTTDGVIARLAP